VLPDLLYRLVVMKAENITELLGYNPPSDFTESAPMPVRPIVRLGHPALRAVAGALSPESLASLETQQLIDDMVDTMHEANGVGLAAPQVAAELQLFVYESSGHDVPLRVVVNPMITPHERELVYEWEGCLSIPDLRGMVPRHPAVRVQGLDRHGRPLDYLCRGFEARIVQHEFDHLNGVVFLDRMRDFKTLGYIDEWGRHMGDEKEDETAVG
jgi:peptide deformylase